MQTSFKDVKKASKTWNQNSNPEERLKAIFESSPNAITVTDLNGIIIDCSESTLDLYGYSSKEELIGRSAFEFIAEKDHKRAINNLKKTLEQGSIRNIEYTCIAKNGNELLTEISASVIKNFNGDPVAFVATAQEHMIEKRLSALNKFGRKVNRARTLQKIYDFTIETMENTLGFEHAALLIVDKNKLRVASQSGYPIPLHLELQLGSNEKGITVKAANTRKSVLISDVSKDPNYVEGIKGIKSELAVPIEIEGSLLGILNVESKKLSSFNEKDLTLLQILASHAATAISNLKKRKEIEKRSNQLASLMKNSTKMISSTNIYKRLQTVADTIKDLGWRRVVISIRDKNMQIKKIDDIVTAGLTKKERETLWKNRSSGKVWQDRFGKEYERFRIGEFYHLSWNDPWVRKQFESSTIPSKLPPEEMVDWDPQDLLYAPLRLADGQTVGILSIDDPIDGKRPTKKSLTPLQLFIHQAAVAIENARLIKNLNKAREQLKVDAELLEQKVEERTLELRKSQEKLVKTQRLAVIGELASMVGHDLRNPLTGITGASYYLKSKLEKNKNKKIKEMLEIIERDIEYANKIINDLLEYSKDIKLDYEKTSLKELLKETLSLMQIPKNIKIHNQIKVENKIFTDKEKLKRVFINIIKNAFDAMPSGGKLTMKCNDIGYAYSLSFTDTGMGIPRENMEKIWIPLFTTKAKGMGLGLPICKRIIEAHGGKIHLESNLGKGTKITVRIPLKNDGGDGICIEIPEYLSLTTKKA